MLKDVFAVSYASYEHNVLGNVCNGQILVWSIRNIEYPQCVIRTQFPPTCVSFSFRHGALLAAGMSDGSINIYNIYTTQEVAANQPTPPLLSTAFGEVKHNFGVSELQWVDADSSERGESLVSTR